MVESFKICPFNTFSDHAPLQLKLVLKAVQINMDIPVMRSGRIHNCWRWDSEKLNMSNDSFWKNKEDLHMSVLEHDRTMQK